jgi:hypothetical protein
MYWHLNDSYYIDILGCISSVEYKKTACMTYWYAWCDGTAVLFGASCCWFAYGSTYLHETWKVDVVYNLMKYVMLFLSPDAKIRYHKHKFSFLTLSLASFLQKKKFVSLDFKF